MKKVLLILSLGAFGVIGFLYLKAYVQERNIQRIIQEKLDEAQTIDLLGQPSEIIEGVNDIPGCGVGAKTLRYFFTSSVLILRFEDGLGISFKADGEQCQVNRTSI